MNYNDAKAYVPAASFIYVGVTALEAVNCPVDKFITEVNGVVILGTLQPYPAISAKEVKE